MAKWDMSKATCRRCEELETKLATAVGFIEEVAEQNERPESLWLLAKGILKELEDKDDE